MSRLLYQGRRIFVGRQEFRDPELACLAWLSARYDSQMSIGVFDGLHGELIPKTPMIYTFGPSTPSYARPPGTAGMGGYYEVSVPVGARFCRMIVLSCGGGGGSGRLSASGTAAGGGGGGGGGAYQEVDWLVADLNPRLIVMVPAGGTGGAAQGSSSTNGNPGTLPSTAWLPAIWSGLTLPIFAGVGGSDGSSAAWFYACAAESGTGICGLGGTTTTAAGGTGSGYGDFLGGGGAAGVTAGGAGTQGSPGGPSSVISGHGGNGGGSGGGMTSTLTGHNGGNGAVGLIAPAMLLNFQSTSTQPNGATSVGGAGGMGLNWSPNPDNSNPLFSWAPVTPVPGGGGGGGAGGNATHAGGAGGNGGLGSGGGGGGGSENGQTSGAGGNGGDGAVALIFW